jgi:ribose transport system permease protein
MKSIIRFLREEKALLILIVFFLFLCFRSEYFLSVNNLSNLLMQCAISGIMAYGMTFAIIGGEFDLSVGSTMSLCGLINIMLQPYLPAYIIFPLVIGVSIIIGLCNGVLIAYLRANAFIITIGTSILVKGIALTISNGKPVLGSNASLVSFANGKFLALPNISYVFFAVLIITQFVLTKSKFGRNVFAVGGNQNVAAYAGIKVKFYKCSVFVITACTAAISGILVSCRLNTGSSIHGDNMPLMVISSVVVGGTSLAGGEGSALKTLVGILIFGILDNAMSLMNVYSYYQTAIKGVLVILIVGTDCYARTHFPAIATPGRGRKLL